MARFIIVTFAFMGWTFYEMSGGSEFDAIETRMSRIEVPVEVAEEPLDPVVAKIAPPVLPENVTRVALSLTSVNDVLRPASTLVTKSARKSAVVEEAVAEALSEEPPTILLPSLVQNELVFTPVDFNGDAEAVDDAQPALRAVTGTRVNVRGGPGTGYSVVNSLVRGDEVEILQDPGNGWIKLRPAEGGTEGWVATFLLSEG